MNKTLVVDGTYLIRRQFHATKLSQTSESTEDNMVQDMFITIESFLTCLQKIIREQNYSRRTIVLWDRGTYRYRPKEKFTEFKADRDYSANHWQCCWDATTFMVDFLRTIGIDSIQVGGLEADDLGMYFSHNSKDCMLWAVDSDWKQSLTPTTVINRNGTIITYDEVYNGDPLKTPIEYALMKAIDGGHDNLTKIQTDLSYRELFDGFQSQTLDRELISSIRRNLSLSRLDQILTDTEVHRKIHDQLSLTHPVTNDMMLGIALSKLKNVPPYYYGVFGKYNREKKSF